MLAKHKVGSSTLLTRSIFKPSRNWGLFYFRWSRGELLREFRNARFRQGYRYPIAKNMLPCPFAGPKLVIHEGVIVWLRWPAHQWKWENYPCIFRAEAPCSNA